MKALAANYISTKIANKILHLGKMNLPVDPLFF